ncbi:MAG: Hsp20/alpha crystallin family protein [Firmicutes bacterium]|nr:Hsp20/alpha crystallin family protein [Alicyclobacillaceae bacterium]MCL6496962.1 Hsp20/alpha crystallin family protein [Bacillota bacterium]
MALMRWDPTDVDRFREDMQRFWNRFREEWNWEGARPRTRFHQTDEGYLVEFELPGVDPDQVEVEVDGESVTVRGQFPPPPTAREGEAEAEGDRFHSVVTFPTEVDPETAEAHFRHGLLSVRVARLGGRRRRVSVRHVQ